jgi:hypothetical protein
MKSQGTYPGITVEESLKKGVKHFESIDKPESNSFKAKLYSQKEDFQTPDNLKNKTVGSIEK